MLGTVALSPRHVSDYESVAGAPSVRELRHLAAALGEARILNLSLATLGSWLTDLLSSSMPLLQDLGVDADWRIVRPDHESDEAMRAFYRALGGQEGAWTVDTRRSWQRFLASPPELPEGPFAAIVVHDPQLLGLVPERAERTNGHLVHWIWDCHLDLSSATPDAWADLRPFAERCDAVVFEDRSFAPPGWQGPATIVPPGIDPLGPRNVPLDDATVTMLLGELGVDPQKPLIAQISPFDAGSDALGLLEVHEALLPRVPDLQLAIVPTALRDDEQTRAYFDEVARRARDLPGSLLLPLGAEIGNAEINAFQQAAALVVQKSLRKGFALWLSEAMWKQRPVVAGRTGGTAAQIVDGQTGYLVPDTATCVARVGELLADKELRLRLGRAAREHVASNFLITRYLADVLQLLVRVVGRVSAV
jgi:trehalose synthase